LDRRVDIWFPAAAAVSGWYLLGVSVTVAAVVYPSFALVGAPEWPAFHTAHSRAIVLAVGPGWVVEGVGSVGWLVQSATSEPLDGWQLAPAVVHAVAAAATVVLTVAAAVPVHTRLGALRDAPAATTLRRLRVAHVVRTAAWAVAAATASVGLGLAIG
jgi:hypothetical protein